MAFKTSFEDIALDDLMGIASQMKRDEWRCVQMHCVNTEEGIDLTYTFCKDGQYDNYQVRGVKKGVSVPSLQSLFLGVFPFENEAHDLFGVDVCGMVLDFGGHFYQLSKKEPMTIISPAQKEAREKAARIAAAKAAKASKGADSASAPSAAKSSDDIEAKLASMDPEKAAKLRTALESKARKAACNGKEGE
jgi:hypothetical protein